MNTTIKELKTMMNQIITASETTDTDYHIQFRKQIDHHEESIYHVSVCFYYMENEIKTCTTVFFWNTNSLAKNQIMVKIVLELMEEKISIEELKLKYGVINETFD